MNLQIVNKKPRQAKKFGKSMRRMEATMQSSEKEILSPIKFLDNYPSRWCWRPLLLIITSMVRSIILRRNPQFLGDDHPLNIAFRRILSSFCKGVRLSSEASPLSLLGFRIEGASMSAALHQIAFGSVAFDRILKCVPNFPYTAHVGAGWAAALFPKRSREFLGKADPLLRWLCYDGWGFHDALFNPSVLKGFSTPPNALRGYELRAWDQGLGRCSWFLLGGDADQIAYHFDRFDAARRCDLWSGIGLACAYAGGVEETAVRKLNDVGRLYLPHLAQGVAFATKARVLAGEVPQHTENACDTIWGLSANKVAQVSDDEQIGLPPDSPTVPAYEVWRTRIRSVFESHTLPNRLS